MSDDNVRYIAQASNAPAEISPPTTMDDVLRHCLTRDKSKSTTLVVIMVTEGVIDVSHIGDDRTQAIGAIEIAKDGLLRHVKTSRMF